MLAVAPQKKKPVQLRKGKPINAWINSALRDAFDAARKENRRSVKDELEIALEKHLKEIGLWPWTAELADLWRGRLEASED